MKLEKIAVIAVLAYLAIALPVYLFNGQATEKCETACNAQGYRIVLAATGYGQDIECRCFNPYGRTEKYVRIGED